MFQACKNPEGIAFVDVGVRSYMVCVYCGGVATPSDKPTFLTVMVCPQEEEA